MTEAEGTVPPDVAEALLALQGLVNELVAKTLGAASAIGEVHTTAGTATAIATASGTWSFTGTAIGQAPPLTPEHVTALRRYAKKLAAGTVVAVAVIGELDALASFAERILDLMQ
ncbi:hypothetical protein JOD57_003497 [Geodermatophilus bullaregiensis]|uniref:hypothetical protein n=1 Tax=Geodermatophilus bullaregiensis TaxID=1564160 RepID=UPI001959E586|nr:hypothetical protein [Geodermatophilus bullaregiensis]MBM7807660.1 hypothetical protein [Geodermatophilus bullaregiensis]